MLSSDRHAPRDPSDRRPGAGDAPAPGRGPGSAAPGDHHPNRTLRRGLLAVLLALVGTAVVVQLGWSAPRPRPLAAPGGLPAAPGKKAGPPATTAVTVPLAASRDGCGLHLGSATPPAPIGRCTVLEVGDSIGNDIGWGIARHIPTSGGLDIVQLDKSASGLANTGFYDWQAHLAAAVQQYHPDLVLVCIGGDDQQGMDVDGSSVQFPSAAWKDAYRQRVERLLGEATSSGAYVMWLGLPVMADPTYSRGAAVLNDIYQQAVSADPHATFLPLWTLFADPQGQFRASAAVDGSLTALRNTDGIHLSYAGENVAATYVIDQIARQFDVQLAPTDPSSLTG